MAYDGATGWLVGEPNHGLAAMFTMMNNARLGVGIEGAGRRRSGLSARGGLSRSERRAGPERRSATAMARSVGHADVRRMLLTDEGR